MKRSAPVIAGLILALALASTAQCAPADSELSDVTATFSPAEMGFGSTAHMVVTVQNNSNRTLTVTSITVTVFKAMPWGLPGENTSYLIYAGDGVVPAGESGEFGRDGDVPPYVGSCPVVITVVGALSGDGGPSVALFSADTMVNPATPDPLMAAGLLLLVVPVVLLVAAFTIIIVLQRVRKRPPSLPATCPACAAATAPGAAYCSKCGQKL